MFEFPSNYTIYCDEEIWHPHTVAGLWGKEVWHASYQTTIVISRISSGKRGRLSSTLSISTSRHGHGKAPLPISHVFISGEADRRPWLVLMNKPPKSQHVIIFQTTETRSCRLVVEGWRYISHCFCSLKNEDIIWDTEETPNSKVMPRREHWEKRKSFPFEWTRTPRYGEPR